MKLALSHLPPCLMRPEQRVTVSHSMDKICHIFRPLPILPPPVTRAPRGLVSTICLCKYMAEYEWNVYVYRGDVTLGERFLYLIGRS